MNTPIVDFVQRYAASGTARLHMPGHKGVPFLGCEPFDITEIAGADDLLRAEGIIAESEQNAAALFGTGATFYSVEGATLPIKAMLALAAQNAASNDKQPRILATRNAHKSFLYGCALLDLDVDWLYGEWNEHLCTCSVTADTLARALAADASYCAVFVTSPDYLGNLLDIEALSRVSRAHGIPLLVDNAHGAYLAFASPSRHPIALGATMCADSAHKTLPALTGTAYLHLAKDAPSAFYNGARAAMALFASSSPSYLLLQSLDLCNRYLAETLSSALDETASRIRTVKDRLASVGYRILGNEPLKITVDGRGRGYDGDALAKALREGRVEPEFSDRDCVVLMCTPQTTVEELARIETVLASLPVREPSQDTYTAVTRNAPRALSIRAAMLSPFETVSASEAEGRICAVPTVSCPPAIPIVISGEIITKTAIRLFAHYGIDRIAVVKENR